jgi:hypothetical protein
MSSPTAGPVVISRAELVWITLGLWTGGICILTLLPVIFIPRLGIPMGMAASYLVFFLAWQPVQAVTQRVMGMQAAVVRMLAFVASAAVIAYYLREGLLAHLRG